MIKQELRYGNYIMKGNDIAEVVGFRQNSAYVKYNLAKKPIFGEVDINTCEPIPLNDKKLYDLGFEDIESDDEYNWKGILIKKLDEETFCELLMCKNICAFRAIYSDEYNFDDVATVLCEINYVHELQNIYFDLSGKELKL